MESEWYRDTFPNTRLSKNKKAIADFETSRGGGRFSTSVNGTLTGRGADYLIIDDPIKPDDALSDLLRKKINEVTEKAPLGVLILLLCYFLPVAE